MHGVSNVELTHSTEPEVHIDLPRCIQKFVNGTNDAVSFAFRLAPMFEALPLQEMPECRGMRSMQTRDMPPIANGVFGVRVTCYWGRWIEDP